MTAPALANPLTDPLTDAHLRLIAGRQDKVVRTARGIIRTADFANVFGTGNTFSSANGILRNLAFMPVRAALSHEGRLLLTDSTYELIRRTQGYSVWYLYPHVAADLARWQAVATGRTNAVSRFWKITLDATHTPVPSLVAETIIPAFTASTADITSAVFPTGGQPAHIVHPVPYALRLTPTAYVAAGETIRLALEPDGGAEPFTYEALPAYGWIAFEATAGGDRMVVSPPANTPAGELVIGVTATDAAGIAARASVTIDIRAAPAP